MKFLILLTFIVYLVLGILFVSKDVLNKSIAPSITPTPTYKWSPTPTPVVLNADKLFQLVNSWRIKNGYQPYIKSDFACSVVDKRLPEIVTHFSHDGFYAARFCKECYLAENLVTGYDSESRALDAWLNSPDHLRDLKDSFTHSCLKCSGSTCDQTFTYF